MDIIPGVMVKFKKDPPRVEIYTMETDRKLLHSSQYYDFKNGMEEVILRDASVKIDTITNNVIINGKLIEYITIRDFRQKWINEPGRHLGIVHKKYDQYFCPGGYEWYEYNDHEISIIKEYLEDIDDHIEIEKIKNPGWFKGYRKVKTIDTDRKFIIKQRIDRTPLMFKEVIFTFSPPFFIY